MFKKGEKVRIIKLDEDFDDDTYKIGDIAILGKVTDWCCYDETGYCLSFEQIERVE